MSWRAVLPNFGGWRVQWGDGASPDLTFGDLRAALDIARKAVPPARNGRYGHKCSDHRRRLCEALASVLNQTHLPLALPMPQQAAAVGPAS